MSDRSRRFFEHIATVNLRWLLSIVLGMVALTGVFAQRTASMSVPLDVDDTANEMAFSTDYEIDPQASGTGSIFGYGSASSVVQGGSLDFHIATNVATHDIQIFREGAAGREWMMTITDLPGSGSSPSCADSDVGTLVDGGHVNPDGCGWPVAYTLNVPANWPSGIYLADLLDEDDQVGGYGSYIFFIVTEDEPGSTADILLQSSTNTWQAYNDYGNRGLYTVPNAVRLTFDRPYPKCYGCKFYWEVPLVRWLESEGYVIEYVASKDVHYDPTLLYN